MVAEQPAKRPAPGPGGKRRGRRYRPWFFLLAAAFLLAGAGYAFYSGSLDGLLMGPDDARQDERARLARQYRVLSQEVAGLREELRRREREAQEAQEQRALLPPAFQEIHLYWALMEAEHLLVLASHRLAAGEAEAAIAVLELADTRLRGLDAPGLEQARHSLEADLARIRAAGRADARAWSAYLADLGGQAQRLPLRPRTAPPEAPPETAAPPGPEEEAGERSFFSAAWSDMKGLLTIRKAGDEPAAARVFGARPYARQMLKLEAEHARLAVLRRDDADFQNSRGVLVELLRTHFDPRQPPVQEALAALEAMQEARLRPELPGPDSSLENLRAYMREFSQ